MTPIGVYCMGSINEYDRYLLTTTAACSVAYSFALINVSNVSISTVEATGNFRIP